MGSADVVVDHPDVRVALSKASNCVNEMISKNQLKAETTVETVHTILCGSLEEYSFPPEAMAGAIIGSLIGFGFLITTIICIRNVRIFQIGSNASRVNIKNMPTR